MNKEWHQKNKMPRNPTLEQRKIWHFEHARHCGCRPIPYGLLKSPETKVSKAGWEAMVAAMEQLADSPSNLFVSLN